MVCLHIYTRATGEAVYGMLLFVDCVSAVLFSEIFAVVIDGFGWPWVGWFVG